MTDDTVKRDYYMMLRIQYGGWYHETIYIIYKAKHISLHGLLLTELVSEDDLVG